MKILIDFDDVIFNTNRFKDAYESLFAVHGISKEIFKLHYYDPNDTRKIRIYDFEAHLKRIEAATGVDFPKLSKEVHDFLQDVSQYVFPDVLKFVDKFGKNNICIVSFGEVTFLRKKIIGSGILKYVENAKIIDFEKSRAVAELFQQGELSHNEKIYFLDDRTDQISDIKGNFPDITTILIKRPEGRYKEMQKEECCNFMAHNLMEAEKIITMTATE